MALSDPSQALLIAFGDCLLDEARRELIRAGQRVRIQPKALELLMLLVRNRERVVGKQELIEALWPETNVGESSLMRAVSTARRAIGEPPRRPTTIRNFSGAGYRFCTELRFVERAAGHPSEAAEPLFVGREGVLDRLGAARRRTAARNGQLVVLTGEAGIGKTFVAERSAADAREEGFRSVVGRCHQDGGAPSFWAWAEVVTPLVHGDDRQAIARDSRDDLESLAQFFPQLRPETGAPRSSDPDSQRFQLFDAVARLLRAQSRAGGLSIVLEDFHCADAPSLLLLQHVAAELEAESCFILVTLRETELARGSIVARTLAELTRHAHCQTLKLQGFDQGETAQFLEHALGRPPPAPLTRDLSAATEGNPLYLREVVRLLESEGLLGFPEGVASWHVEIPPSIRQVITRRLDNLSAECNRVLEWGAVIGRRFPFDWLAHASSMPRGKLLEALDEAIAARLIFEIPGTPVRYNFSHALLRETVYSEIPIAERARVHEGLAEAREAAMQNDPGKRLAEVAYHFHAAIGRGNEKKAVRYALRAAEQASRSLAHDDAARHYEQALEALAHDSSAEPHQRLTLLLALGNAQLAAGAGDGARDAFLAAATSARELERDDDFVQAVIGYSASGLWGGAPAGDVLGRLLREAIDRLSDEAAPLRARLLSRLQGIPRVASTPGRADEISREAIALARASGDSEALLETLLARLVQCSAPDQLEEREALESEIITNADAIPSSDLRLAVLENILAADRLARGDRSGLEATRTTPAGSIEEVRHPSLQYVDAVKKAGLALLEGRHDDAEHAIRAALARGQRVGTQRALSCFLAQTYFVVRQRGRVAEIESKIPDIVRPANARWEWIGSYLRTVPAVSAAELGQLKNARSLFDELAREGFSDFPRRRMWLVTIAELAAVCVHLRDVPRAMRLYDLLQPYKEQHVVFYGPLLYAGPVSYYLGTLAAVIGNVAGAVDYLHAAAESAERLGAMPWLARSHVALGKLGEPTLLESGTEEAARLGMEGLLREARAALGGRT